MLHALTVVDDRFVPKDLLFIVYVRVFTTKAVNDGCFDVGNNGMDGVFSLGS